MKNLLQFFKSDPIKTDKELDAVCAIAQTAAVQISLLETEHEARMAELNETFTERKRLAKDALSKAERQLKAWAIKNRKERFDGQTLVHNGHKFVFRKAADTVEVTDKRYTLTDVVDQILASGDEALAQSVLTFKDPTLNKTAVKSALGKKADPARRDLLASFHLGLKKNPETFKFTPAHK